SLTDSRKLPQQVLEPPSNGKIEYLEAPVLEQSLLSVPKSIEPELSKDEQSYFGVVKEDIGKTPTKDLVLMTPFPVTEGNKNYNKCQEMAELLKTKGWLSPVTYEKLLVMIDMLFLRARDWTLQSYGEEFFIYEGRADGKIIQA
ncbi:MAG: hypothetical protein K2X66_03200, partial [Cyanobacteria bacterium]|nr:hypothetical protein [Cyanobacteriota bacterium]